MESSQPRPRTDGATHGPWISFLRSSHLGPRFVLGFAIVAGLVAAASMALTRSSMVAANYSVYHRAAEVAIAGGDFYAAAPPAFPSFTYLYPPATVLGYVPLTLVSPRTGFLIHSTVSIGAGLVLAWTATLVIAEAGIDVDRLDVALIGGVCLLSPYVVPTLVFGNVNLLLAAGLAVGFVGLERGRSAPAGVLFGAVASVKIFPALVGAWLLRLRAWGAILAATAMGLGVVLVGIVVFGVEVTQHYLTEVLLGQAEHTAGVTDPARGFVTLHRPLSLVFDRSGLWLVVPSVIVLAPVVGYSYVAIETARDRLIAYFTTVAAVVLAFPSTFTYVPLVYFPFIPLLYILKGRSRRLFLVGGLVMHLAISLRNDALLLAVGPSMLMDPLMRALTTVLSVGTFPTFGLLVCLGACMVAIATRTDRG